MVEVLVESDCSVEGAVNQTVHHVAVEEPNHIDPLEACLYPQIEVLVVAGAAVVEVVGEVVVAELVRMQAVVDMMIVVFVAVEGPMLVHQQMLR